jgi:hypothetical protein
MLAFLPAVLLPSLYTLQWELCQLHLMMTIHSVDVCRFTYQLVSNHQRNVYIWMDRGLPAGQNRTEMLCLVQWTYVSAVHDE